MNVIQETEGKQSGVAKCGRKRVEKADKHEVWENF